MLLRDIGERMDHQGHLGIFRNRFLRQRHRLHLPAHLRDAQILLIIDGHKSRISVLAAVIFIVDNIAVLVFPAHDSRPPNDDVGVSR
jgi:hypothetical protein